METILLLASLITSTIFLVIFSSLLKEIRTSKFNKKEIPLIVLGLTYLTFTITLLLWGINFFKYNTTDFFIVFSITLVTQTICLLTILYEITKNKKILYTLVPFIFLIPSIIYTPQSVHLIIPISLFITLLNFLSVTSIHEKTTKQIILYTSISLFFYLFAILWQNLIPTLTLISSTLFLIFLVPFLRFLKKVSRRRFSFHGEKESPILHFLKHFIFIIIMTNFIFIGTISVHELGHLLTSSQSNCEETRIVYELSGLPHTEVKCENTAMQNRWIAGGILLPLALAFFLFFSGGKFIKEIALQIVGFNLIISYLDIQALGFSEAIATFVLIIGATFVIFSLMLLAKSRIE